MNIAHTTPKYTLEKLQESYDLNIPQAISIMEKFGSEKVRIDRFMRRCNRRRRSAASGTILRP